jgi:mitochondrial import inner membrane translocase subunit TIM50
VYKRPGAEDFLMEMAGYFELVLYTDRPHAYVEPIMRKIDPHRWVPSLAPKVGLGLR